MTLRYVPGVVLALLLLAAAACNDSTEPVADQPPVACLDLQAYLGLIWQNEGILFLTFGVDPLCTSDDVTRRHNLDVRWDFEADGEWDTDWLDLEYLECVQPDPLPADIWRVRMEARDEAGNISSTEAELQLPDEIPRQPDIGVSPLEFAIRFLLHGETTELVGYASDQVIWGWRLDEYPHVVCEMYVDDQLVNREEVLVARGVNMNCGGGTCFPSFRNDIAEHLTPGIHEITVIIDATDVVPDEDETNNTCTVTVEIGEDGLPVTPGADP